MSMTMDEQIEALGKVLDEMQPGAGMARLADTLKTMGVSMQIRSGAGPWEKSSSNQVSGELYQYRIAPPPPQKKVRPLNAEEWPDVAHCVASVANAGCYAVPAHYHSGIAHFYFDLRATCHPPGNSKDVRRLWVVE